MLSAAQVAELERIPLEQVYELGTIQFLNDMAYLKDKAQFDEVKMKAWQAKARSSRA